MNIHEYIESLSARFRTGKATEHTYRGDLQRFLETNFDGIHVTNEPKRISCGAPDYILTRGEVPVGYIEAKDVGSSLDGNSFQEQFDRYRSALPNLIITDYLEFRFFRNGEQIAQSKVAEIHRNSIREIDDDKDIFLGLMREFVDYNGRTIRSSSGLAKMMASKARLMANILAFAINEDVTDDINSELRQQYDAFRSILIHDLEPRDFADIYSQSITYGMFAARLHDRTLDDFTRQEAATLIPKSNPLLRKLFYNIAGPDLDQRIDWIVDELADIFRATDVASLLEDFGKNTERSDPFIHFYETFLAEYDPALRRSRGVWYTPESVVNFIVRAVDTLLEEEFGLTGGLSNSSKTSIRMKTDQPDRRTKSGYVELDKEVHKVQVLDPATGTGTFLSEVVKEVHKKYAGQQGIWQQYVEADLLPRLHGFELLMASYAIAHMKLEMLLEETGYKHDPKNRLQVYLTNSLEEHHPDTGTLFASWLSNEASAANQIKRDSPVMVVLGNPPYSAASTNKDQWILDLIDQYKFVEGEHFGERKHWLNDDYVKFIRYGQHFIEKNGEGVLAYINNHGFLDNTTFRGMRWNLLNTFNDIYIIDLHGNSKKNEVCPDGSPDVNVFDIQLGVSINIFVKRNNTKRKRKSLAKLHHADVWGDRESKYDFLWNNSLKTIRFETIEPNEPYFFFKPKFFNELETYKKGFSLDEVFTEYVSSIVTMGDSFIVAHSPQELESRIVEFLSSNIAEEQLKDKYSLGKNYAGWIIENKDSIHFDRDKIVPIDYRPFDQRYTYFDNKLIWRWREKVMRQMIRGENIGLLCCKQSAIDSWEHVSVTDTISDDSRVSNRTKERGYIFPLYKFAIDNKQIDILSKDHGPSRSTNLNDVVVQKIAENLNLEFSIDDADCDSKFSAIDIFDYIYAVLHSIQYREAYLESLKVNFPRVPYPSDSKVFRELASLGGKLRQLHLLKGLDQHDFVTTYPIPGDNKISRSLNQSCFEVTDASLGVGRLWINDQQYFDSVPITAWEMQVGGYRPAEKWLKDRKNQTLGQQEVFHYQAIIAAMVETDRTMNEIDNIFTL